MTITVLLTSGDEDEWTGEYGAVIDQDGILPGSFLIVKTDQEFPPEGWAGAKAEAIYAPGMWMKIEFDRGS